MATTLEQLTLALARALLPLADTLAGSTDEADELVRRLGWALPSIPPAITAMSGATQGMFPSLGALEVALEDENDAQIAAAAGQLAADVAAVVTALHELPAGLRAQRPPPVVAAPGIDAQFQDRLLHTLGDELLEARAPLLAAVLLLLGLREHSDEPADGARFQPEFVRRSLHPERLGRLLADPAGLMRDLYGWGTPALDSERLFEGLMQLGFAVGIPCHYRYPPEAVVTAVSPGVDVLNAPDIPPELVVPLLVLDGAGVAVGLMPAAVRTPTEPQGLVATLLVTGALAEQVPLNPRTTLHLTAAAELSTGLSVVLRPSQAPEAHFDLGGPGSSPVATGRVAARLVHGPGAEDPPLRLLTIAEGSWIEARSVFFGGGVDARGGAPEPTIEAGLEGGRFVLAPAGTDSFISRLLPPDGLRADFDLGLEWSRRGMRFSGSAGLDATLGVHAQLGPLLLESVHVALSVTPQRLALETSLTGGAALGPFTALVDRLGASTELAFRNGNLGSVDLALRFKPPSGIGLAVDVGIVKGGGYLFFGDGEYAGVLDLSLRDIVQIKAVGLIATRQPDGSPGFSMVLVLTGEFPPIQLGFGFTLTGVGGVVAVNRAVAVETLRTGLRNHTLDSILFPPDPIRNAPRIISDLRSVFPPAAGRYAFGPMVKVGWGTPTLITATLGVVLEVPDPVRLVVVGQLHAALPSQAAPLVRLNIDVLGVVDFAGKRFALDGSLYDSTILVYALSGDMAARVDWGDMPSFALSHGGLHPRFQPPPGFPQLRRLTLSLGNGDNPRLSTESYMAVTSNSVQFGARVELYASSHGFGLHGYLGFDVLVIVSPFSFEAGMEAGVELLRGSTVLMSIHLELTLSGPTPWRARGKASFKVLFVSISVGFDISWGDDRKIELPASDARGPLRAALADPRNWSAALPPGAEHVASLGPGPDAGDSAIVHPLGQLSVRQRVAPLGLTITRFGSGPPLHWNRFEVTAVRLGGQAVDHPAVQDRFARGQYFQLSDDEQLSRSAFEPMDAGVLVGGAGERAGHRSALEVHYETNIVDEVERPSRRLPRRFRPPPALFGAGVSVGAAAASRVLGSGDARFAVPGEAGTVDATRLRYAVASTVDLTRRTDIVPGAGATQVEAELALERHLALHPQDAGALQVTPVHEAVTT